MALLVSVLVGTGLPLTLGVGGAGADPTDRPFERIERFEVDAADPAGYTTTAVLEKHATYLIQVSGRYAFFGWHPRDMADAECSVHGTNELPTDFGTAVPLGQPGWQAHRFAVYGTEYAASDPSMVADHDGWDPDPADDPLDLYVDGRAYEWIPMQPHPFYRQYSDQRRFSGPGCSADNSYSLVFSPPATRRVNFRIVDLHYEDNLGSLRVDVTRLAGSPFLDEPPGRHVETVLVNSADAGGTATSAALAPGHAYLLLAHGVFHYQDRNASGARFDEGWLADAACSKVHAPTDELDFGDDRSWRRDRYPDRGPDHLELLVGGAGDAWLPVAPTQPDEGCDRVSHYYAAVVTGPGDLPDGRLSLGIDDDEHADNRGTLSVEVLELPAELLDDQTLPEVCVTIDGGRVVCSPATLAPGSP